MSQISELVRRVNAGESGVQDELFSAAYGELSQLARARLRHGGRSTCLDTGALVHESCLRLLTGGQLRAASRRAFFAYASRVMRSVIIDAVREHQSQRRGGAHEHLTLDTRILEGLPHGEDEVLRVHEALDVLAQAEPRLAKVVEMRYFAGCTEVEIAEALLITERTVRRDWDKARLLLMTLLLS